MTDPYDPYPNPAYPPVTGQPGYGYPQQNPLNGMAVASMVTSIASAVVGCWIAAIVGAILGHVSLKQLREQNQAGEGFAKAGIIVGWCAAGFWLLIVAGYLTLIVIAGLSGAFDPKTS